MRRLALFLILCFGALAVADDFKTTDGKEYKNAKVSRVEPDGIVMTFSGGIVKIPFVELPKQIQEKYGYDVEAAKKFAAESAAAQEQLHLQTQRMIEQNAVQRAEQEALQAKQEAEQSAERALGSLTVYAVIRPYHFREQETAAHIQIYRKIDGHWQPDGEEFSGTIDEAMPQRVQEGDEEVVTLYKIGHTEDTSREPRFTLLRDKALKFILTGQTK